MRVTFLVILLLTLVGCGQARFVDPSLKANAPSSSSEPRDDEATVGGGASTTPVIAPRVVQTFKWKKSSGVLNIAFVVRLEQDSVNAKQVILPRLRYLADNLGTNELQWKGIPPLNAFESIRTTIILEKPTDLNSAPYQWSDYDTARDTRELRAQFRSQVMRLEANLNQLKAETFPEDPFSSLERVAQSAPGNTGTEPAYLHLVYLRDRDIFLSDEDLAASRGQLLSRLKKNSNFMGSTFSLLSYEDEDSTCKPHKNDIASNLKQRFAGLLDSTGELCEIPKKAMTDLLTVWLKDRGKVILRQRTEKDKITVTVDGIPHHAFTYHENTREIQFRVSAEPKIGSRIEVSYEPSR